MILYGAIWAKYPNVAYLEGRLKSNKYGKHFFVKWSHQAFGGVAIIIRGQTSRHGTAHQPHPSSRYHPRTGAIKHAA